MSSVCIKNQLKRYLRFQNIKRDKDLKKRIQDITGEIQESVQENVGGSSSVIASSEFQICKQTQNKKKENYSKQKNVQGCDKIEEQRQIQTKIPININFTIIKLLKQKKYLLLGKEKNKQEDVLKICAFMIQKQKWTKVEKIAQNFDQQERSIIGIGLYVSDDFIMSSDLDYLKSLVKQKGLVLIFNTKTDQLYLFQLTNTTIPESDETINYIKNNTYLKAIASNKNQIEKMTDLNEDTKTKQIIILRPDQNQYATHLQVKGDNVKNVFQYQFAKGSKKQIPKRKPQRLIFFTQKNNSLIKKCEVVTNEKFQNFIQGQNKQIIPTCKNVFSTQNLNLMWKNNIVFGGIFNHRYFMCFFRISGDPSNEKNITFDKIQESEVLKVVSKLDSSTQQVQDVNLEIL